MEVKCVLSASLSKTDCEDESKDKSGINVIMVARSFSLYSCIKKNKDIR